ncbi:DUF1381 domain-containing protein, partial [Staphylococcus pseudintermedius]
AIKKYEEKNKKSSRLFIFRK